MLFINQMLLCSLHLECFIHKLGTLHSGIAFIAVGRVLLLMVF